MSEALFPRVLGAAFDTLPDPVKRLHMATGHRRYCGQVEVARGNSVLSHLCARAARLPPAGQGALEVEIESGKDWERWTRHIGGRPMPSQLWEQDGLLCERLGLLSFGFALAVERDAIVWRVIRVRALGIPLPVHWFSGVTAYESEGEGRYCFDVAARLPVVGLLVHYQGWLHVE